MLATPFSIKLWFDYVYTCLICLKNKGNLCNVQCYLNLLQIRHLKIASMCVFVCVQVCVCLTCSDKELLYFFDMRFLIVSLTDLTFLPSEIRDVVGDLTTSLYIASCSLFCD